MIVQELHDIQHQHGYLPVKELRALAARTGTRLHRLQEVASFFPHFRLEPPAAIQVKVCMDMSCQLRGSCETIKKFQKASATFKGPSLDVNSVSCLGRCDRAPVASISATIIHNHDAAVESDAAPAPPAATNGSSATAKPHSHGPDVHEYTHYYNHVDRTKLVKLVKQTAKAVTAKDKTKLPPSDTDIAWNPDQTKNWSIDVYDGKPDGQAYMGIVQLIARQSVDPRDAHWKVDDSVIADVEKALRGSMEGLDLERKRILASLFTANLLGMGGAGGRAYKKWFEVYEAEGDVKYVVCNGDESEPGTFKDRELLLRAPHLVVEGVALAGLLLGARHGYIYIRHEFEEQIEAVRKEIKRAERMGVIGNDVLGSGLNMPVEVFVSPGGYICGEQTALIEAMEDKRAEPRNRPPELQTNGLWDCPTLLNNVETLAWVPAIVLENNGNWFADRAHQKKYKGRRFFSISGDVAKPGAYEVPIGITLREFIQEHAGGMTEGEFKAAALSGPSGGFVPRQVPVGYLKGRWVSDNLPADATHFDILDMELDIQTSRDMGIMMGAGMVMFNDNTDMVATALCCTEFYRNESCGKCVPCRIGSQKLVEMLTDISNQRYTMKDLYGDGATDPTSRRGLVKELSETMQLTAICGLGTVASNPLISLFDYFKEDIKRYAKK